MSVAMGSALTSSFSVSSQPDVVASSSNSPKLSASAESILEEFAWEKKVRKQLKKGEWDVALEGIKHLSGSWRCQHLETVAKAYFEQGELDKTRDVVQSLYHIYIQEQDSARFKTARFLQNIAYGYVQQNEFGKAEEIAKALRPLSDAYWNHIHAKITQIYLERGELDRVVEGAWKQTRFENTTGFLRAAVEGYRERGEPDKVQKILDENKWV